MADKPKKTVNEAQQDFVRFLNMFPMAQGLKESLDVALNLEGQKSVLDVEIKELAAHKQTAEDELKELRAKVELARSQTKSDEAKLKRTVEERRKTTDEEIAAMDKEYEEARARANQQLADQLRKGREEVDTWTAKKGNLQREVHRMEAEVIVLEQRKAQA